MTIRAFRVKTLEAFERSRGAMVWRRAFPGQDAQVSEARDLVRALFAGYECVDDAALIATELCTNAVRHTRSGEPGGWFGLEVHIDDLARINVLDLGGGGRPNLQTKEPDDELVPGGLGITLVSRLSETLGVHGSPAIGHTVWADLDLTSEGIERRAAPYCPGRAGLP